MLPKLMGIYRGWWFAYLTWPDIAAAAGPLPASIPSPVLRGVFTDWRARRRFYRFRRTIFQRPRFAALLYSNGFAVAPQEWPASVLEVFPTDAPPSPYEVACVLHHNGRLFGATKLLSRADFSFLMWWLVGAPLEALRRPDEDPEATLLGIVTNLLRGLYFFLWALGDDLMPVRASTLQDVLIRRALFLPDRPTLLAPLWAAERNLLREAPYIRAILLGRRALRPMKRRLPSTGHVFASIDEKLATVTCAPGGIGWFFAQRTRLRRMKYLPEWANLAYLPGEPNVSTVTPYASTRKRRAFRRLERHAAEGTRSDAG